MKTIKMNRWVWAVATSVFLMSSSACSKESEPRATKSAETSNDDAPGGPSKIAVKSESDGDSKSTEKSEVVAKKIIKNAKLTLEDSDPSKAKDRIEKIVATSGGYIQSSEFAHANAALEGRITMKLRVPADKFADVLAQIRGAAVKVVHEQVSSKDVTSEYVDLQSRMRAKRAYESQMLKLLESAKTIPDALEVQKQLSSVRTEIEQLEGQLKVLTNQTGYSTIELTVSTIQSNALASAENSRTGIAFHAKEAVSDVVSVGKWIIIAMIRILGVFLPFATIVGLPLFLFMRWLLRRNRSQLASR
jgi:hypothetical protein